MGSGGHAMKCPGQDSRYWKPEDIFELLCPACAAAVEFFKDDKWRACPKCGQFVKNSNLDLGCAEWCSAAEQCLLDGNYPPDDASDGVSG
jgi:hypothetical protein